MTCSRHAALLELMSVILTCGDADLRRRALALRDQIKRDLMLEDARRNEAKFREEAGEPEGEVLFHLALVRFPGSPLPYVLSGERDGAQLVWLTDCLARAVAALPAFAYRLLATSFTRFGTRH